MRRSLESQKITKSPYFTVQYRSTSLMWCQSKGRIYLHISD